LNLSIEERLRHAYTKDGSLDFHGKPAIKDRTGGWRCGTLLLVNQGLANLAFAGVEVNMVLFAKSVLRQTNAEASNTFSRWMGSLYLSSLMGAFLSDSYLGRYLTCVTFQAFSIIGLLGLSFATQSFLLRPHGCGKIGQLCDPHSPAETAIFYISIYLFALGIGAPEPALATFGADQFDEEDPKEKKSKTSFYSYFYIALNLGCLFSETVLVYAENMGYWVLGFWICAGCDILAFSSLLSGTLRYRHFKPSGNPLSRFSQVIVASLRKINLEMPTNGGGLFEVHVREYEANGTRRILHTNDFKFLDRAAIMTSADITTNEDQNPNQWRLCTVTQVEEMLSLFVEQGAAMNTGVSNFQIPPASMTAFDIVSTTAFILLYDKLIVPLYLKVAKRRPKTPSELQRVGIGLAIATVAMIIAGIVEQRRLKYASFGGEETSSLSIFWQTPQYVLLGVSEAFVYVAQMEFFASQIPNGLKSLGIALSMSSTAIGTYVCSMILSVVMVLTTKNGKPGWVPPNLNDGHLDRFFFLSATVTAMNLGVFVVCARRYKSISLQKQEGESAAGVQ
ncbi:hypothetical protein CISIN_1g035554mg, partial [Citrus sinensis]